MKIIYLAGPYRAETAQGVSRNIMRARDYAIKLWQEGYAVICPHLNSAHFEYLVDSDVFLKGGIQMLRRCDLLALMPGSDHSEGTQKELEQARLLGMEVICL